MATGDEIPQKVKEVISDVNVPNKVVNDVNVAQDECDIQKRIEEVTQRLVDNVNNDLIGYEKLNVEDVNLERANQFPVEFSFDDSSVNDSGVAISLDSSGTRSRAMTRTDHDKRTKIGHRRIRDDGQVTYKNILTSRIVNSIQLGIKHAITQITASSRRDLLMQDFMTVESVPFSSSSESSPLHTSSRFVFKTYAPVAFGYFRDLFGIKSEDYLTSFCQKPLKELSNSGNSGSIFYLTGDDRFIVKTTQKKECSFLQSLLPGYYLNLHQNPNTLLPKYFGLYCYKCDMKKIRLVAMNNILPTWIKNIQAYDLKGATYKCRVTAKAGDDDDVTTVQSPTFKDLDFLQHHPSGLFLNSDVYNTLMKTIKRDCTVLESFKIMDYSLLLGISKIETQTSTPKDHMRRRFPVKQSTGKYCERENTDSTELFCGEDKKLNRFDSAHFSSINELKGHEELSKTTSHSSFIGLVDDSSIFVTNDPLASGGIPAFNGEGEPILIFTGIIDILQSYKLKKKVEHAFKSLIHDADTISVHNPKYYSLRFQRFMSEKVFKRSSPPIKRKLMKLTTTKLSVHQEILKTAVKETVIKESELPIEQTNENNATIR